MCPFAAPQRGTLRPSHSPGWKARNHIPKAAFMIRLPSETTFTYIYPLEVEVHLNSGKLKLLFARVYLSKQNVQHCKTYIILFCSQNNTKSDCRKKKTCSHAAKTLLFKVSAILKRFPPSQPPSLVGLTVGTLFPLTSRPVS